jgi:hypothetical protein
VLQRRKALASSYSCDPCSCQMSLTSYPLQMNPATVNLLPQQAQQVHALAQYVQCGTNYFFLDETVAGAMNWLHNPPSPPNPAVAVVDNVVTKGMVTAVGGGSTAVSPTYQDYAYSPRYGCPCDSWQVTTNGSAPVNVITVSGPQTVWWFNGQNPSGYTTSITLTASPAGAPSYTWAFTQGSDKATLSGQSGNTINLSGRKVSASTGDVKVKVTVNGVASNPLSITVRGPYKLVPGSKLHSPLDGCGYASQIYYTIYDNLNAIMPSTIAFGEQWTTAIDNRYAGTNWERPTAHGDTTSNSQFYDYITGPGLNNNPPPYPTPTAPQGGNTEVQRSGQEWRVGSTTPGAGARVQTDTWHRYTDHGDNDAITSPAP